MIDCTRMFSLLGFHILCAISIVYTSDISCYVCNSADHSDCGLDGSRLIAEMNSTLLRTCIRTESICSLSYKTTTTTVELHGQATRRHSYARNCISRDEKEHLETETETLASDEDSAADTTGYHWILVRDLVESNTLLRMYFCEFSGCNYKSPNGELDEQLHLTISCYDCSSTSDDSCGFVLSTSRADEVLIVCPSSHLCLSSFRQDKNTLARFDFNRSCASEAEVTLLRRIYGNELVGMAADSSDQIHFFACDSPGCNDVFPGSNLTSISCFVCNESSVICSDIDGRRLGGADGKQFLRPCPSEEPHHCSIMIFYDSKQGLATKIDRRCMLTRLVRAYQESGGGGGGEATIIKTSDPKETFYLSFCRTTGCNWGYGRPELLPNYTTTENPLNASTFTAQVEMQKSSSEDIGNVSLTTLLMLMTLSALSRISNV